MTTAGSLQAVAYHESGHAVAATVLGTGLISVDIRAQPVPGGGIGRAGADLVRPPDKRILGCGEDAVMPYLITFTAGWVAEKIIDSTAVMEVGHPHSDGELIRRYAIGAVCTPVVINGQITLRREEQEAKADRIAALLDRAEQQTQEFVDRHRKSIDAVAAKLLEKEFLSAANVQEIVAANSPLP